MKTGFVFCCLLLGAISANVRGVECGDDGPNPLDDVSGSVLGKIKPIETLGGVKELAFLEKTNALVYRNQRDALNLASFLLAPTEQLWPKMNFPLSQVLDPQERYLAAEGGGELFDLEHRIWRKFDDGPNPLSLFWEPQQRDFVSIRALEEEGRQKFEVIRYWPEDDSVSSCIIRPPAGKVYQIARGQTAPYIHLYTEVQALKYREIQFVRYTTDCHRKWLFGVQPIRLRAPLGVALQDLYQYSPSGPTALKFDHREKSLIVHRGWSADTSVSIPSGPGICHVYDIQNLRPFFVHRTIPILATWSRGAGMRLYFLDKKEGQMVNVTKGMALSDIAPERLWLTRDAQKLFIAPDFEGEQERQLFEVTLAPPRR